jgi:hypothetical protein
MMGYLLPRPQRGSFMKKLMLLVGMMMGVSLFMNGADALAAGRDGPPPSGAIKNESPYNKQSILHKGIRCSGVYKCNHEMDTEALTAITNQCANDRLGFENAFSRLQKSGDHDNCFIPTKHKPAAVSVKESWPICCLESTSEDKDMCTIKCYVYVAY